MTLKGQIHGRRLFQVIFPLSRRSVQCVGAARTRRSCELDAGSRSELSGKSISDGQRNGNDQRRSCIGKQD